MQTQRGVDKVVDWTAARTATKFVRVSTANDSDSDLTRTFL